MDSSVGSLTKEARDKALGSQKGKAAGTWAKDFCPKDCWEETTLPQTHMEGDYAMTINSVDALRLQMGQNARKDGIYAAGRIVLRRTQNLNMTRRSTAASDGWTASVTLWPLVRTSANA